MTRSQQMLGYDSNYVPGWDCHGLPIEWKIEEEYRAKGKNKDAVPINEFRAECRAFAEHWLDVQREEFKRLGVEGDWDNPYTTMSFAAEAQIARELMKFAANGTLYRGSKPVMWSVVEKTALAEAEVEYEDYAQRHDLGEVSGRVRGRRALQGAGAGLSRQLDRHLDDDALDHPGQPRDQLFAEDRLRPLPGDRRAGGQLGEGRRPADPRRQARRRSVQAGARRRRSRSCATVPAEDLAALASAHPLKGHAGGYEFVVPLLAGDHVTDDAGTGFVHTAPGHGREDFDVWTANARELEARGINTAIPYTVDENGAFTDHAPGFAGKRVITDKGEKGDANEAVIKALADAGMLIARGRLKHQYPHSWRSKKPVIFRNTPQWFIAMDKRHRRSRATRLRHRALTRSRRPAGSRRRARTASPA